MDSEAFKSLVVKYSGIHEELKALAGTMRDVRKQANDMKGRILEHMQAHAIDECAWSGGRIVRKSTKKTEGLKKEHIAGELKRLMGDTGVDEAVSNMYNRRITDMQETLAILKTSTSQET